MKWRSLYNIISVYLSAASNLENSITLTEAFQRGPAATCNVLSDGLHSFTVLIYCSVFIEIHYSIKQTNNQIKEAATAMHPGQRAPFLPMEKLQSSSFSPSVEWPRDLSEAKQSKLM